VVAFAVPLGLWQGFPRSSAGPVTPTEDVEERMGADAWLAKARTLAEQGDWAGAAEACNRALQIEPFRTEAQAERSLLLARAGDAGPLFDWLDHLVVVNAFLADGLLDRSEFSRYRTDARFAALREEARMQAMD